LFSGISRKRVPEHRRDVFGEIHAPHERHAHQCGDRIARQIVLRRAQTAAHEHRVRSRQQVAQRVDNTCLVVADRAMLVRVDARQRELLTDPGTIRVDDLPEK
jgi:hypothetical protein